MKLDRYAQIITAVLGTLILIGIVLTVAVPVVMFVIHRLAGKQAAIHVEPRGGNRPAQPAAARLTYGSPILTDQSEYVMVPVRMEGATTSAGGAYLKSYASRSYSGVSKSAWIYSGYGGEPFHNLVFRHKQSGESHLLLDKPAVISRCYFPTERPGKDESHPPKFLLVSISDTDTNHDGVIDEEDAAIGYMSDLAGRQMRQVTPPNTQLLDWEIDRTDHLIYLRVRGDTNHDGKFTDTDDEWIVQVSADQPAIGTPVVDEALRQKLRQLLLQ